MHSACAGPPPVAIGIATFPTNAPGANRSQNTLSNPLYVARYTGVLTATISADATDASASSASAGRTARSTSVVDAPASPNEVNTSSNTRLDFEAADGLPDTPTTEKRFEIEGPISTRTHHVRTTVPERVCACLGLIDGRPLGHRAWPPGGVSPITLRAPRPPGRQNNNSGSVYVPPFGASGGHRLRWRLESAESQRQRRQHEETQRRRCDESPQDHRRQRPFDLAARRAAA